MKYAVMSDAHANPLALATAIGDARRHGCGRILFLGDITGYGYDAKATLAIVRDETDVALMGNHDSVCLGREEAWLVSPNPNYDLDVAARRQLDEDERRWLSSRKLVHREAGASFVHGEYSQPEKWGYILSGIDALRNFLACGDKLLFCGHSHHAAVWELNENGRVVPRRERRFATPAMASEFVPFKLNPAHRYIVNVGSVGYPRCDFCSTYAIWEPESARVSLRRLPFAFTGYIAKLLEHRVNLPRWLLDLIERAKKLEKAGDAR